MESQTNPNKRKRLQEESDEEKQEKRQRLDDTFDKLDEVLKNKSTAFSKAETHTLDNIDDKETNQTEQGVSRCLSATESKNEKENAKSDASILLIIKSEKENGAIEMTVSAQSLDSEDNLNVEEVRDSDTRGSSTPLSEFKNDANSKDRDTKAEDESLGIKSDTEKCGEIKDVSINDVQENETSRKNCVEHQIENNLEERYITNKGRISPRVLEESKVRFKPKNISDANSVEYECNNSDSTTESEKQIVTSETSGREDNAIDENRFLYRLLKPGDSFNHAIEPKDFNSNTTIDDHVACGSSDFVRSRYISCSKTRESIGRFAYIIKRDLRSQLRYIVRIDKTKLDDDCKIYDLTEESVRTEHLHSDPARRHSLRFDEVLLAPAYEIPVECFTKVATVQNGTINWDDNAS